MNLTIDIGNTLSKLAVLDEGQIVDTFRFEALKVSDVAGVLDAYSGITAAIMISARPAEEVKDLVRSRVGHFIDFNCNVPVPLKNLYHTPHTLGPDRLAAAVAANAMHPNNPVLVVDFGSAITIDVVSAAGEYLGGNISPGAGMRLRALNTFTPLPLCRLADEVELYGTTSEGAIESGVVSGIVYEIEGYVARFSEKFDGLRIIFTGGDGNFFAKRFKNPIFATYDLVAYGLNRILEYNNAH